MAFTIQMDETDNTSPVMIKVIGIGGGGCNALKQMMDFDLHGVELIVANTDKQVLQENPIQNKLQLGVKTTRGMGAGSKPEVGRAAAEEDRDKIRDVLNGADMVFIAAGMGGGTGTGAAPVIANVARDMGILTVAIVTKPFTFEGMPRMRKAEAGLEVLKSEVDCLVIIPNDRISAVMGEDATLIGSFKTVDNVLRDAVYSIATIKHFSQSGTLQFFANAGKDFLVTGGDLFDQVIAGDVAVGQVAGAGQGDAGVVVVFAVERAVAAFEHFRSLARHAQGGGEGTRYLFAAHGQGGGVYRLVVPPQHDVRRARAEVNGADAEVAFFGAAGGIAGGESGVDDAFDFHARVAHALAEVGDERAARADDVRPRFEFVGDHAARVNDVGAAIDEELLFQDVQGVQRFAPGRMARAQHGAGDVAFADAAVAHGGAAVLVERAPP